MCWKISLMVRIISIFFVTKPTKFKKTKNALPFHHILLHLLIPNAEPVRRRNHGQFRVPNARRFNPRTPPPRSFRQSVVRLRPRSNRFRALHRHVQNAERDAATTRFRPALPDLQSLQKTAKNEHAIKQKQ